MPTKSQPAGPPETNQYFLASQKIHYRPFFRRPLFNAGPINAGPYQRRAQNPANAY